MTFLGRPQGMTLCLHDRVSVCVSVCLSVRQHWWVYIFFIGLYLFNTATDQVHFCHACTLGPGLYSPNVFRDAALINYANLCKICQSVNILVYTFLSVYIFLIQQLIEVLFLACMYLRDQAYTVLMFLVMLPSLIMLIYANFVKIT